MENNKSDRLRIWNKTNGHCWYCGRELVLEEGTGDRQCINTFTVDHLIPLSRSGRDEISNKVPACFRCNKRKANRTLDEYRHNLEMMEFKEMYGVEFTTDQMIVLKELHLNPLEPRVFYGDKMLWDED